MDKKEIQEILELDEKRTKSSHLAKDDNWYTMPISIEGHEDEGSALTVCANGIVGHLPICECDTEPDAQFIASAPKMAAIIRELLQENEELSGNIGKQEWADKEDEYTEAINKAHPTITGDYKTHGKALEMINNRHGKYELVDLVNWLLKENEESREELFREKEGEPCY